MIRKEDLTELSNAAYATAVKNGFYENPSELGTRLMLIITEMAERNDAEKNLMSIAKRMKMPYLDAMNLVAQRLSEFSKGKITPRAYAEFYKINVKDTVEAEFAGTLIRLLDMIGSYGYEFQSDFNDEPCDMVTVEFSVVLDLARFLEQDRSGIEPNKWLLEKSFHRIFSLGNAWINHRQDTSFENVMILFVDSEMAYNTTREKLHGKKF